MRTEKEKKQEKQKNKDQNPSVSALNIRNRSVMDIAHHETTQTKHKDTKNKSLTSETRTAPFLPSANFFENGSLSLAKKQYELSRTFLMCWSGPIKSRPSTKKSIFWFPPPKLSCFFEKVWGCFWGP